MWKYNKLSFLLFLCIPFFGNAQDCKLELSGLVLDQSTGAPISFANIYIKELASGAVTDSLGVFKISGLCPGDCHMTVSHIGCEKQEQFFTLTADTVVNIILDHNSHSLNEVAVVGEGGKSTTEESTSVNKEGISQNTDKDLATMIENMAGVSTIKNGSGISKPVVHGLSGNRLMILNNGVAQSGQQWGTDHSPEIDPLVANRITVVKGVGAIEYQGSTLGSVVLVEPEPIKRDPHLHGAARSFFETNGLGAGLNLELQEYNEILAWRAVGTLKKSGDNSTPDYYLRNTGSEEANMALQLEKAFGERWMSELYLSSFNANIGVLRGSHIGNLTDLEEALTRDEPFYTQADFSYDIDAPYQKVNHNLLKFHTRFDLNQKQRFDLTYAFQYNLRKEFDVRRSGRSDDPALSLEQSSHFLEGKYRHFFKKDWVLKTGVQLNRVDNANLQETGVLPLVPDYLSDEIGLFARITKSYAHTNIEFGARTDFESRRVAAISMTVPREVIRYNTDYQNIGAMAGVHQALSENWSIDYNIGYATRNPEVNELYSNGLHQGVSGIEEGDPNLAMEQSLNNTLSIKGNVKGKLYIESLVYYQNIDDYIFLNPTGEVRLTIRGAFPVFKYEQTNASIYGLDLVATYQFNDRLNITGKYSYLEGTDRSNDIPLVNMPANNLFGKINFSIPKWGGFQNLEFEINNRYVFEQTNLLDTQDFVSPPEAYNLVGARISADKQIRKLGVKMFVSAENIFNVRYRDYLNRQRYFADDLGINLILGINVSF